MEHADFARVADRTVEGGVFADGFFAESANPVVQEFVERYRKRFQATPSLFAAQGYDAARLAVEPSGEGATSERPSRDYLMMQHDLPTLSGPGGFSPDGTLNRHVFSSAKQGRIRPLDQRETRAEHHTRDDALPPMRPARARE